jgi:signal transduction histidine kinase
MGNLLDHAIKYLEPERDGSIEITAEQGTDEYVFRVRDNGRGIAEEDIRRVFELFRRAGKQDVPGEGMGLAYVKALVRRHGGRIWCESEPGIGTTFSFTIPGTREAAL